MEADNEHIERMLEDCETERFSGSRSFSKWEESFLESVSEQWNEEQSLSPKQIETLENIWRID